MTYNIKLYKMIIIKELQRFFIYRTNIFTGIMTALFMLGARYALWMALFATGNAVQSSLLETMTYFIISGIIFVWISPSYGNNIGEDIRSGDIAQRLIRPCSYHLMLIASFHATSMASTLIRSLPTLIVALIFISILPPASTSIFLFFLLAVILGAIIFSLVDLIISYTAFWMTDFWYLSWFKRALFTLFGGLAVPLWFYPEWLRMICEYLPFQYTIYQPLAIYLGRVSPDQIITTIAVQVFWVAVLFLIERIVWRFVQKKLVVQGG